MLKLERILVPVDFSDCSRAAFEYAVQLAERVGARIDVMHAWVTPAYVSPYVAVQIGVGSPQQTLEELAKNDAREQMAKFVAALRPPAAQGEQVGVRIEFGPEAETIATVAAEYDLIVMGTHGRSGLSHLLMGSVAEKVLRKSPCPVLTVRHKH